MSAPRPLTFGVELAGMFDPPTTRSIVGRVEQLEYDQLWWCDYRFYRDVYSLLTQTALFSERLGFGTFVTDPFARHPALTAGAMATADELGAGRATMGIGAGVSGLREMGIERARPAKRIAEAVDLIRALWRQGRVSFAGETVRFEGQLDFVPRPNIPIYIASNGPITLGVAGEKGDGVIVEGLRRPAMMDYVREHLEPGLERAGRSMQDLEIVARLDLFVDEDRALASHVLRRQVQHYVSVHGARRWPDLAAFVPPKLEKEIRDAGFTHDPAIIEPLVNKIPPEAASLIALAGNVEDVAAQVEHVRALGATHISIFPVASREHGVTIPDLIERFAGVMREVRARSTHSGTGGDS